MVEFVDQENLPIKAPRSREFTAWSIVTLFSLVLASGIAFGIWYRSFDAGWNTFVTQMFFYAPFLAFLVRDFRTRAWLITSRVILILWGVFVAYSLITTGDTIYLGRGDTYPTWLATEVTMTEMEAQDFGKISLCKGESFPTFYDKKNGYFARCGFGSWLPGNTFLILNPDVLQRALNSARSEDGQ